MGVCITATNTAYEFRGSYGSFAKLRINIAKAFDSEFGELYTNLIRYFWDEKKRKSYDDQINSLLKNDRFAQDDIDIIDFLYASDCEGECSYKTCMKIYNLIKDIDFGNQAINYGYYANNDYEKFKEFLLECYSHRRNMVWY